MESSAANHSSTTYDPTLNHFHESLSSTRQHGMTMMPYRPLIPCISILVSLSVHQAIRDYYNTPVYHVSHVCAIYITPSEEQPTRIEQKHGRGNGFVGDPVLYGRPGGITTETFSPVCHGCLQYGESMTQDVHPCRRTMTCFQEEVGARQ